MLRYASKILYFTFPCYLTNRYRWDTFNKWFSADLLKYFLVFLFAEEKEEGRRGLWLTSVSGFYAMEPGLLFMSLKQWMLQPKYFNFLIISEARNFSLFSYLTFPCDEYGDLSQENALLNIEDRQRDGVYTATVQIS